MKECGVCRDCNNPIDFSVSETFCRECFIKHKCVWEKRIRKSQELGLCCSCMKQPINYSRSSYHCTDCLEKRLYETKKRMGYYPELESELKEIKKYLVM